MTLLAALARAGSTTPIGRPRGRRSSGRGRTPSRRGSDPRSSGSISPICRRGNMALNMALQDGDTINVPKAQSVFVAGQVKSPGAYAVEPGTTVLQVLSLAGGLTDRGSDSRIRIQRTVNGKKVEVDREADRPRHCPATRSSSESGSSRNGYDNCHIARRHQRPPRRPPSRREERHVMDYVRDRLQAALDRHSGVPARLRHRVAERRSARRPIYQRADAAADREGHAERGDARSDVPVAGRLVQRRRSIRRSTASCRAAASPKRTIDAMKLWNAPARPRARAEDARSIRCRSARHRQRRRSTTA